MRIICIIRDSDSPPCMNQYISVRIFDACSSASDLLAKFHPQAGFVFLYFVNHLLES